MMGVLVALWIGVIIWLLLAGATLMAGIGIILGMSIAKIVSWLTCRE
jgi:hypothetical protein